MIAIDPRVMADLLPALTDLDDWREVGHVRAISVSRVVAWAWRPDRLKDCKERLEAGQRAPAINVSRYWLNGLPWYNVGDGQHRTIAARKAGHRRIRARIIGESWCKPGQYIIMDGRLWQKQERALKLQHTELTQQLTDALIAVGVTRIER